MTNRDRLRRRYQRLLWAYPAWYRRERGTEMLTTLLDAADRHRPGWREALDLVAGGIRCRLRPPGPLAATLVIIAAIFAAILGSAAAVRGGLVLLAPLPTEDEAIAIATAATGQRPHNEVSEPVSCPFMCPIGGSREDQVVVLDKAFDTNNGLDQVAVGYWLPATQLNELVNTAHARLAAQGWEVTPLEPDGLGSGNYFDATKDDLLILVGTDGNWSVEMTMQRVHPPIMGRLGLIGLLVGGLIGWLLACWVTRRFLSQDSTRRTRALATMAPALATMLMTILGVASLGFAAITGGLDDPLALAPAVVLSLVFFRPEIIAVTAIFLGIAVVLAVAPSRGRSERDRSARDNAGGPHLAT